MPRASKLIQRQLRKSGINLDSASPEVRNFVALVEHAYRDSDHDRALLEHAMDISSREMSESNAKLRQLAHDKSALAEVRSKFLANMSHEIRTPLNGILGLADMLLDETMTQQQVETLTLLRRSAAGLLSVINDILDLSKIEAGKFSIQPSTVELRPLLNELVQIYSAVAQEKHIEIALAIDSQVPRYAFLDPGRLRQVLTNIIGNSIKFTPLEGGIIIHVTTHKLRGEPHEIYFAVADTGIGISTEMASSLFTPFSQGDDSITKKFGGTGLGLSISQRFVNLMGGELKLKSKPGVGTTFYFSLPYVEPDDATIPTTEAAKPKDEQQFVPANYTLLVAEDNSVNQKVIASILSKVGFRFELVGNGKQAVEAFRKGRFDLILMDCQMPEMSGFEATEHIRREPRGAQIPIVALTALAMEKDKQQCLNAGMSTYLAKPFNRLELIKLLTETLLKAPRPNA